MVWVVDTGSSKEHAASKINPAAISAHRRAIISSDGLSKKVEVLKIPLLIVSATPAPSRIAPKSSQRLAIMIA